MFGNLFKNLKGFWGEHMGRTGTVYTFRIGKPRPDQACDDLVGADLLRLNVFVVADKPTPGTDHLLLLTTKDESVIPERILELLNEQFNLDAEFLSEEKY